VPPKRHGCAWLGMFDNARMIGQRESRLVRRSASQGGYAATSARPPHQHIAHMRADAAALHYLLREQQS
jgi:hypothetical protein